ncbi:MAG: Na+/H+ antiporter NhaC family protein [Candidatus Marinimicrobia bacterium]|jgi:Na+/H+ antiporter NhaC|nr:Na+/H+ antiporter NhaC family protein [Candidatus Neomarinimicrobiota bacterium]MDD4961229.1 Na+/H+ antiporter NhaC family protein [Candidatus Neomarinimicrobiota bacterium]MDD5710124.1 Na+/H+ antiporter NhaC family protein [Candidatus Neomarinimicrobiota bacterium]MDX9777406.1 Na+/H+ antiporter NhaC family protein [bacterium]
MKRYLTLAFLLIFLLLMPFLAPAHAEGWGAWSIIPPLVAISLAFISKNVVVSLFIGIFSGAYLIALQSGSVFSGILRAFVLMTREFVAALSDPWNAGIVVQTFTIGGLIALISVMGGTRAIAEKLAKRARTAASAQIYTWLMGIFIFFDDYANLLTVGPIMRPVMDKMKVSREKLAFIIDSTAAPIADIALISTWIGYELGLIKHAYAAIGVEANAYHVFIQTIPYRFYSLIILFFIVVSALSRRDFGPMLKAERRARLEGKVVADGAQIMSAVDTERLQVLAKGKLRVSNALVPVLTLIIGAFAALFYNGYTNILAGSDTELVALVRGPFSFTVFRECFSAANASIALTQSAILASLVAIFMGWSRRIFGLRDAVDAWIKGAGGMVITVTILILAWSLSGVIGKLGAADYLVGIISGKIPPFLLSAVIFIFGALISFATGTSYGTMGILMPLAVPLAYAVSPEPVFLYMCIAAVLSGAIFGDHCSPISDTTILSSMGAACDHIAHVNTQIIYAIPVAFIAILICFIPTALGLPVWISLLLGAAVVAGLIYTFGRHPEDPMPAKKMMKK